MLFRPVLTNILMMLTNFFLSFTIANLTTTDTENNNTSNVEPHRSSRALVHAGPFYGPGRSIGLPKGTGAYAYGSPLRTAAWGIESWIEGG